MKFKLYPTIILVVFFGCVAVGLTLLEVKVSLVPSSRDPSSLPIAESPELPSAQEVAKPPAPPTPIASPSKPPDPAAVAARQGTLRVSNPSQHPIRLALLPQQDDSPTYGDVAHWDFAPQEGGSQGLILSLPQQDLTLEPGDIVVAFAQDGSRLYWGPYVVGETSLPVWNSELGEWQLILQP